MPNLREHCKSCLERYGYSFKEIHKWMDKPVKIAGAKHRSVRHELETTPSEAEKIFWEEIPEQYRLFIKHAVIDHLVLDREVTKKVGDTPIYLKLDQPKTMRFVVFHLEKMKDWCDKLDRFIKQGKKKPRILSKNFVYFILYHTKHSVKHYPCNSDVEWSKKITILIDGLNLEIERITRMKKKRATEKEALAYGKLIETKCKIEEIIIDVLDSIEATEKTEMASIRAKAEMKSLDQMFKSGKDIYGYKIQRKVKEAD